MVLYHSEGDTVSEQTKAAVSAASETQAPQARTRGISVFVEVIGGLLTAGAILFALNGGAKHFSTADTLSLVSRAEITDAARTLDPSVSGQLAEQARQCTVPLAYVTISKTADDSGGAIRIHSGSYVSPVIKLTDTPQRVAIPFPAPFATGKGTISVEGATNGALISLTPGWRIDELHGSVIQNVVWNPSNPC